MRHKRESEGGERGERERGGEREREGERLQWQKL